MKTNKKGFSLIELMIVVAILGILAAVAVPAFTKFMYNSKSAEIPSNFDGILKSEQAYYGSNDSYMNIPTGVPTGTPGKTKFAATVTDFAGSTGFVAIQFSPSGNVYGQYSVPMTATAASICTDGSVGAASAAGCTNVNAGYVVVTALTNIDGDAANTTWTQPMGIATGSGDVFLSPKIAKTGDDF